MKQQKDFFKIYDSKNLNRLIAVVNLNYMFPIPKEQTSGFEKKYIHTYRTFRSEEEKSKYINLLDTELDAINKMNLEEKARAIYKLKYEVPEDRVAKRCINFKDMERLAKEYGINKNG